MANSLNLNTLVVVGGIVAAIYLLPKVFNKPTSDYTSSEGITYEATQPTIRTDIRQNEQTERAAIRADLVDSRQEQMTERTKERQETIRQIFSRNSKNKSSSVTSKTPTYQSFNQFAAANPNLISDKGKSLLGTSSNQGMSISSAWASSNLSSKGAILLKNPYSGL